MIGDPMLFDADSTGPDGRGYVRLWRKIIDSEVFLDAELLRLFLWILVRATHRPQKVAGITLQPGEMLFGRHAAAADLRTPLSSTYDRLHRLKTLEMVGIKSGRSFSVVTVTNWESYQEDGETDPTGSPDTTRNESGTYKHKKHRKHSNNNAQPMSEAFAAWYSAYPRHVGKLDAEKAYPKAVARLAAERSMTGADAAADLLVTTQQFAAAKTGTDPKFIPHPATWLKAGRYLDDPANWSTSNGSSGPPGGNPPTRPRTGEYGDPTKYRPAEVATHA